MDNLILQGTPGYVICFLILNLRNLLYVIEIDVKVKCLEERITQAQLAEMVGTSASYISRLINKKNSIGTRLSWRCLKSWATISRSRM